MGYTFIHKSYSRHKWNRSNCTCERSNRCRDCCGCDGPQGIPGPPGTGSVIPSVERYFYIVTSDIETPETIPANQFTNDDGMPATAFPASFAYYTLYMNAMVQTADTSSVTTAALTIPDGDVLDPATPIVVEFVVT